jgi:hypothetical protein
MFSLAYIAIYFDNMRQCPRRDLGQMKCARVDRYKQVLHFFGHDTAEFDQW